MLLLSLAIVSNPCIADRRYTDSMGTVRGNKQIKSKSRVEEHGEVFTSSREVKAMLDLVKEETDRIDSRFLEPACGNGNFLIEVLHRKLSAINKKYRNNQLDYERYTFIAVTSLYGIDLLEDNALECRQRLYHEVEKLYTKKYKTNGTPSFLASIQYVLSQNIVCGDSLHMTTKSGGYITFPEWSIVTGSKVKRRDFIFRTLLGSSESNTTFSMVNGVNQSSRGEFIPTPVRDYPLIDFREVAQHE